ncbi:MAG: glutathione S-transferase family protein [Deltaproteobacteria bacterium]|nr:glutathione S-transferase family protein [Deltaproteobacteria bacterium]
MRIALAEKKIPWEPILVNLREREHKRPEYLAINPEGKVPTIRDGETVVYDSTIINEYLEERYPEASLTYADPHRRAKVRQWEDYGDNNFLRPAENIFIHDKGWRQFEPEQLQGFRQRILESLAFVENALGRFDYLVNRFTYADISFAPRVMILEQLGISLPQNLANVRAWIDRLRSRPTLHNLEH